MSTLSLAGTIRNLLETQWALADPLADDILWADTKPDLIPMPKWEKTYAVGVYSPANPVTTRQLCRELWEITENVCVDIYVKVVSTVEAATQVREDMRLECYRISHTQEFQVSGQKTVDIVREDFKVESPDAVRLRIMIAAVSWDIRS